jgi:hypothetical protein
VISSSGLSLGAKQKLFARLLVQLFTIAFDLGYEITLGEAWRPPVTAAYYAGTGQGIKNSNHTLRLAVDINLFKNGVYLTATEDYKFLGDHWKVLNSLCRWGGDFKGRPDGNHFSLENNGVA